MIAEDIRGPLKTLAITGDGTAVAMWTTPLRGSESVEAASVKEGTLLWRQRLVTVTGAETTEELLGLRATPAGGIEAAWASNHNNEPSTLATAQAGTHGLFAPPSTVTLPAVEPGWPDGGTLATNTRGEQVVIWIVYPTSSQLVSGSDDGFGECDHLRLTGDPHSSQALASWQCYRPQKNNVTRYTLLYEH